jgi:hypothetical protein
MSGFKFEEQARNRRKVLGPWFFPWLFICLAKEVIFGYSWSLLALVALL